MEEILKIMKEMEKMKEMKEMKEMDNKAKEEISKETTIEKIKEILKDANSMICATDKGIYFIGSSGEMMNLLTDIAFELKEEMPKDMIRFAIENGLSDSVKESLDKLLNAINEKFGDKDE